MDIACCAGGTVLLGLWFSLDVVDLEGGTTDFAGFDDFGFYLATSCRSSHV